MGSGHGLTCPPLLHLHGTELGSHCAKGAEGQQDRVGWQERKSQVCDMRRVRSGIEGGEPKLAGVWTDKFQPPLLAKSTTMAVSAVMEPKCRKEKKPEEKVVRCYHCYLEEPAALRWIPEGVFSAGTDVPLAALCRSVQR